MASIASRDLRNHTADALRRVAEGERLVVTVHGDPVAELVPPPGAQRPRTLRRDELLALLEHAQADPGLRDDLRSLGDEMTDDLDDLA
jgi:prevent-host-death family protein